MVKHIIKVDPDDMPRIATTPERYAQIVAGLKNPEEGETLYTEEIQYDTGFIYPSTIKEIE